MPLPEKFREHLDAQGYHPRSDKHSNSLAECVVEDLLDICAAAREAAERGNLVYDLNFDLRFSNSTWNVDLVIGVPASPVPVRAGRIVRATPASVRIAVELKTVMTEHRKAVKNRKRDFEAHHEHVHNYDSRAVAGGVMVVNAAPRFQSPLVQHPTIHGNSKSTVADLVDHCVTEMRNVATSGGASSFGMDAKSVIVVAVDNMGTPVSYLRVPPAPQPGDPLHYDSFLRRLCDDYSSRFGGR